MQRNGKKVLSPKQSIVLASQMHWINNESLWLNILLDRSMILHAYKKYKADKIYQNIRKYYPEMQTVDEHLKLAIKSKT